MDGGNLVPKEGRPLRPASIITREARYRRARRDYARRPGTRASRHSARGRQEPGQALGQDRAGSSRATAAGSSRREAGKLQGMSIPAFPAPLVAPSWRAWTAAGRPGRRPGVPGQPGVGPLRHAAAWCLERPGLARRKARPPCDSARQEGATRLGGFWFRLARASAMSPRPPPIDLSPNQKKNTVGYALCRREWSSAPAR